MRMLAGMDLASQSVKVVVLSEGSAKVKQRFTLSWAKKRWEEFVAAYGAENLVVAFEASPEAHRAARMLRPLGVAMHCFHAADFEVITRSKKKTDRIDADKIAKALRNASLPPAIELPDDETAKLRNLLSGREQKMKMLRQVMNRICGLARQWGVRIPRRGEHRPVKWFEEMQRRFPQHLQVLIAGEVLIGLAIAQALDGLEEEINKQAERAQLMDAVKRLRTIPGVGPVTSVAMAAYLGPEAKRFSSARKVADYLGLVPTISQTGKSDAVLGHITKEGPALLRRLLVQAAHAAIQGNQLLRTRWRKWFERMQYRRGKKIATVAMARKIGIACYVVLRDGTEWNPEVLRPAIP